MRPSSKSLAMGLAALALAWLCFGVPSLAQAELPGTEEFLRVGGFSSKDVEKAKAGEIIRGSVPSSNDRELTATLGFIVKESPKALMDRFLEGLIMNVDRNMISWERVPSMSSSKAFMNLELTPDAEARAKKYGAVSVGTDLNLSPEEISSLRSAGPEAESEAIEPLLRKALAERMAAYQKRGLDGIADYARSGGKTRSVAEDLRSATEAAKVLSEWVPAAYQMFSDYPASKAPGSQERFSWSQIDAHGVPTLILTHGVGVPEGDAWVVMQRQFYVSEGYNCEQALAVFLPVKDGTAVFYVNRTSTDQVSGFGGGAKRSIGSKMLASQLEGIMGRVQK